MPIQYKTCTQCRRSKRLELFHRDEKQKDGLSSHCKECKLGYLHSPQGQQTQRAKDVRRGKTATRRWKALAKAAVQKAVRNGTLPPVNTLDCLGWLKKCDKKAEEYHHWSYRRKNFLKVDPYCRTCHTLLHCDVDVKVPKEGFAHIAQLDKKRREPTLPLKGNFKMPTG